MPLGVLSSNREVQTVQEKLRQRTEASEEDRRQVSLSPFSSTSLYPLFYPSAFLFLSTFLVPQGVWERRSSALKLRSGGATRRLPRPLGGDWRSGALPSSPWSLRARSLCSFEALALRQSLTELQRTSELERRSEAKRMVKQDLCLRETQLQASKRQAWIGFLQESLRVLCSSCALSLQVKVGTCTHVQP